MSFDVLTSKQLTNDDYLNMFLITYVDTQFENDIKSWTIASRRQIPLCVSGVIKSDAVIIVAYHRNKNALVVTKEFRVPLNDYEYGFPAGLIDADETPRITAIRELREETGLEVTHVTTIGPPTYSTAGMTDEATSMVFVECDGEPSAEHCEQTEDITTTLMTQKEVAELLNNEDLKFGAKAWTVMYMFTKIGSALFE